MRPPLGGRPARVLTVCRFQEALTHMPVDGFAREIAHRLPCLFRQGLERRVAPPREPDQRTRVRGHGLPNGKPTAVLRHGQRVWRTPLATISAASTYIASRATSG